MIEDIFSRLDEVRREFGTAILLVEQNARVALGFVDYGYILESGRVVLEAPAAELRESPLIRESYLGVREESAERRYGRTKHYRGRKRWHW